MTAPVGVWDVGVQAERTALAWRRTSLSLAAGSLVAMKVLADSVGVWGLLAGGVGIAGATIGFLLADRRYRRLHRDLHHHGIPRGSAMVLAVMAATVVAVGLTSAGIVCAMFVHTLG
jgi:putative membrane protein